jgi:anaerobic magnesium-protoporphyrin IX monomethyl ester cyclase
MRLMLIQSWLGRREPPVAPLGLASLAAQLPQHEVRIFDPNLAADPGRDTYRLLEDFQPEVIGLSLRNIDTTKYSDSFLYYEHFPDYVALLRRSQPQAQIIVGGGGFSLFPKQIMEQIPQIDVGFFLEAEISLPQFLESGADVTQMPGLLFRSNGVVKSTGPPEKPILDDLAHPAWSLLDMAAYRHYAAWSSVGVETKRGCALSCSYCTYPALSGTGIRLKSASRVVDEMTILKERFGIERVFFSDPVFNYPLEHASAICREILDRGLDIHWSGYHQDRFVTLEYIKLARESGCDRFYFSPDAATTDGLKTLGKASTVTTVKQSLDYIVREGQAKASYNFFAAVPETGWRNFLVALWFLFTARLRLGRRLNSYKLDYIRLEPDTPLAGKVCGTSGTTNLLPTNNKELERLFFRRSRSRTLNLLLSWHFRLGRRWGRKNVLPE